MKLLLEIAGTMEWKIVGLFDSYDEINQWIEEEYDISYEQWLQKCNEDGWDDANREDWYDENEVRIREIPER
jgi:hypothetical protein